jgi:hypothetical protein
MNVWSRRAMGAGAGITLGLLAGLAVLAQSQASSADSATQPRRQIQMVQAQATLDSTLDAKKAKQGEAVSAKLEGNVQIPDAQALPKNTVLEGHVDQVQSSEHKSDSVVVVTFDRAKLKDGQELPIKATVIAVSEPALMQQQAAGGALAISGPPMSSGAPTGGGAPAGGGSMGGGSSPSVPSAPSPQPMNVSAAGVRFSADRAAERRPGCDAAERYSPAQFGDVHLERPERTRPQRNRDAGSAGDHSSRRDACSKVLRGEPAIRNAESRWDPSPRRDSQAGFRK